jgi:hypothetical protein
MPRCAAPTAATVVARLRALTAPPRSAGSGNYVMAGAE